MAACAVAPLRRALLALLQQTPPCDLSIHCVPGLFPHLSISLHSTFISRSGERDVSPVQDGHVRAQQPELPRRGPPTGWVPTTAPDVATVQPRPALLRSIPARVRTSLLRARAPLHPVSGQSLTPTPAPTQPTQPSRRTTPGSRTSRPRSAPPTPRRTAPSRTSRITPSCVVAVVGGAHTVSNDARSALCLSV